MFVHLDKIAERAREPDQSHDRFLIVPGRDVFDLLKVTGAEQAVLRKLQFRVNQLAGAPQPSFGSAHDHSFFIAKDSFLYPAAKMSLTTRAIHSTISTPRLISPP